MPFTDRQPPNNTAYPFNLTWYKSLFYTSADPRIRDFLFMGDPGPILVIYIFYVIICRFLIPFLMRNRVAMKLKLTSWLLKNVILNISMFFVVNLGKIWLGSNWRCEGIDGRVNERNIEVKRN